MKCTVEIVSHVDTVVLMGRHHLILGLHFHGTTYCLRDIQIEITQISLSQPASSVTLQTTVTSTKHQKEIFVSMG